jgi:hypothetical protein
MLRYYYILLLHRLGYDGDPAALCISVLPAWPLLFFTVGCLIVSVIVLVRSVVDVVRPAGAAARLVGSRNVAQWGVTAAAFLVVVLVCEAVGPQVRAEWADWVRALGGPGRPNGVPGLAALAAGASLAVRALAFMQLRMFERAPGSTGASGQPSDGLYVHAGGLTLAGFRADGSGAARSGGGIFAVIFGAVLIGYGIELVRGVELCLK